MLFDRAAGILLHPTSLPSLGGIGDLGPAAYSFADFLAHARQGLWQVLPLSPPAMNNSPYSAISAFAGNPLLISLERLAERELIDAGSLKEAPVAGLPVPDRIDFDQVKAFKLPLLRQAAERFLQKNAAAERFAEFKRASAWWLEDFVLFEVIRQVHSGAVWSSWPADLARREPQALHRFGLEHERELEIERVIQFVFFEQWSSLHSYCALRGIRVVGDVAIFVNYDSADVWRHRELFDLDDNLQPAAVAGVPPDAFSETGQRWGDPLYRWDVVRAQNYEWWVQRMARALETCDILRLDHFRGFESYWEIPASEPTAVHGHWVKGPQDDLFRVLRERLGDLPFIAEDLGMITSEVHALRERLGIPGMKVLQFAFGNPGAHIYLPQNYVPNCVVYSGTHDNDTTLGWWKNGASKGERIQVHAYLGQTEDNVAWAFIRAAWASVARLAIVPLQDVLGLGSEARMNTPSRLAGNWGWRFSTAALTSELGEKLAALTAVCDRAPAVSTGEKRDREMGEDFAA